MSLRISFLVRVAFFVILLSGAVETVFARDSWISVRSQHLLVVGNRSEREIRQVAARLEQFRAAVSQVFEIGPDSPVPTTVIVFRDDTSYAPFKTNENNAGFFQPGQDINYITLSTEVRGDQDPINIIFHEYTHLLVNNAIRNSPPWFNEGMAELYSTISISPDQQIILGRPIHRHVRSLHENFQLPLRTLFQLDYKSAYYNETQKQSVFYAESWALMHYLMVNQNGERASQARNFLKLVGTVPLDQAFQNAFGTTIENMESELRNYIQFEGFRTIKTILPRSVAESFRMTATPVTEAELQAYLGDLLVHSNRVEAEGYLQKALALEPNSTLAHASLGILRFRQGKMDEALEHLERAVAANSQNALVHYYLASVLCHPAQDALELILGFPPETAIKARTELKKAIALRPDFADSYNLLAYINLVTGNEIDETIELLKSVLARTPDRADHRYMLGQLYMHKDDYERARLLLSEVVVGDVEASVKDHAQKLLNTIADIEKEQARKEAARRLRSVVQSPTADAGLGAASSLAPIDPSAELRAALRLPAAGETQVQGMLLGIECDASGLLFLIKTNERTLRLRSDAFQEVRRTTYTAEVRGTITCGPRKPENPVVVCYVPSKDKRTKVDGVLNSVEFVPADFRLLP